MRMIKRMAPVLGGTFNPSSFIFTGSCSWDDSEGGGKFRLRFTSSGTFTPLKNIVIDAFLVGGGGGGGNSSAYAGNGGGGAGYTLTQSSLPLTAGTPYPIVVGAGNGAEVSGGFSNAFGYTANGGSAATSNSGKDGGSGGGAAGGENSHNGKAGGSDGSSGTANTADSYLAGAGQLSTTREFGEASGILYAGGGGGGAYEYSGSLGGAGGAGGGGAGGNYHTNGTAGTANTGGGGGGGAGRAGSSQAGGAGGSGIVVIRNARAV